jgi:LmbE family N-acetylglucosaminyl deacetylase
MRDIVRINPIDEFQGPILIAVPHMDDDVLACGGTIALLPEKHHIHVVYATDGKASPAPIVPWRDAVSPDLGELRVQESRAAMAYLGVPEENSEFLRLPEGKLKTKEKQLVSRLKQLIAQIGPEHIFLPFRYDRHVDHLAMNHAVMVACRACAYQGTLSEYFVYYRYRLLGAGDIRAYIHPQHLLEVDIEPVSGQKREALDLFKSQTTRFYGWQARPNLTAELLDEVSRTPEVFLRYDALVPGPAVFDRHAGWIRLAHRLEPALKKRKDWLVALWARGMGGNGRASA